LGNSKKRNALRHFITLRFNSNYSSSRCNGVHLILRQKLKFKNQEDYTVPHNKGICCICEDVPNDLTSLKGHKEGAKQI